MCALREVPRPFLCSDPPEATCEHSFVPNAFRNIAQANGGQAPKPKGREAAGFTEESGDMLSGVGRRNSITGRLYARRAWCGVQGRHKPHGRGSGRESPDGIQPADGWPLGRGWVGRGRHAPPHGGPRGRSKSPSWRNETADVSIGASGSMLDAAKAGRDATGGAQRAALAKMARYYRAHLAISDIAPWYKSRTVSAAA